MPQHDKAERLSGVDQNRRSFIAKFAGVVFAAPMISSFALDGIARAQPDQRNRGLSPQYLNNQHFGNQHEHDPFCRDQHFHNQHWGNQYLGNQSWGNQHWGNQHIGNQWLKNKHEHHDPYWWVYGDCFPFDNRHGM